VSATGACPRCNNALTPRFGDLGEDVCGNCDGRLLSPSLTQRVLIDEGGISPQLIKDLAEHFAGERLTCPSCAGAMSPVTIKGTPIDVCLGCGATFLDAGELSRLSAGRHGEVAAPPQLIRPVDTAPQVDEGPADPRHTWEKALPMYALEAVGLYAWLAHVRPGWTPLHTFGAALGIMGVPLALSMLVDVDLRSALRSSWRGSHGWSAGFGGYHRNNVGGVLLLGAGVVIGGTVSTVNAFLAERLPRSIARIGTLGVLGGLLAWALLRTVTG
jgi:Zn-finger nucleic acid-binding protein